jgi:hypothetical protein
VSLASPGGTRRGASAPQASRLFYAGLWTFIERWRQPRDAATTRNGVDHVTGCLIVGLLVILAFAVVPIPLWPLLIIALIVLFVIAGALGLLKGIFGVFGR